MKSSMGVSGGPLYGPLSLEVSPRRVRSNPRWESLPSNALGGEISYEKICAPLLVDRFGHPRRHHTHPRWPLAASEYHDHGDALGPEPPQDDPALTGHGSQKFERASRSIAGHP